MSEIFVFGHTNPDNDAIMSAICAAELLNEIDKENTYTAYCLGPLPNESREVLTMWNKKEPKLLEKIESQDPKQKVVLTDHNEISQSIDSLDNAEIHAVIDHHRIADINTSNPICFINLPIGSSCSVITKLHNLLGIEISKDTAGCLLSAIMTDTVIMKSPTCTDEDVKLAKQLGEICGKDPVEYGKWVFNSRGSGDFSPKDMVTRDTKRYEISGKDIFIGQYETVDSDNALKKSEDIVSEMDSFLKEHEGNTFLMLITDILKEGSQAFVAGDPEIVSKALSFDPKPEGVWLDGVLSRKKQVAAPLIDTEK